MHFFQRYRWAIALLISVTALLPVLSNASSSAAATSTLTVAEQPGASPNYIFPFESCLYDSQNNVQDFQQLMFRPLYWFGSGTKVTENASLSLAKAPVYNKASTSVTLTMKGWRFADGQVVNAESVKFFLDMYAADPVAYCGYEQGMGIPDEVTGVSASGNTVKINFAKTVNRSWLTDNFLSQITPMPTKWDRTSATTKGTCATGAYDAKATDSSCQAVVAYLDTIATKVGTFHTETWQDGDDGPWRLTALDATGNATFAANTHYSGPQKPLVKTLKEVAFSSLDAETTALTQGTLDVGYVDPSTLPVRTSTKIGANLAALSSKYTLEAGSTWGFNAAIINFNATNPKAASIAQLYIRQALQEAINQPAVIASVDNGYATATTSPLPPATPTAMDKAIANPYPFSIANAKALLTSHGWTEVAGVMTCTSPGTTSTECGANIPSGYTLNMNIVWSGDSPSQNATFDAEIADWAQVGIVVTPNYDTANNVATDCSASTLYQICGLASGWNYGTSYFPSGEELFATKGMANYGNYSDAHMTALISASTSTQVNLTSYGTYAAQQLPVLYEPEPDQIVEVAKSLKSSIGFAPNPLGTFNPEYFHF